MTDGSAQNATRPTLRARITAGVLKVAIRILGGAPAPLAYLLADLCAIPLWVVWSLQDRAGRRSRGYWRNVRIAYREGGLAPRRPRGHLWRAARHTTWLGIDCCRLPRITPENMPSIVDAHEFEQLRDLHAEGKGIVFVTGHVGVWDVAGYMPTMFDIPVTSVFRPSPVPGIDKLLTELRSGSGQTVVAKKNVIWTLRRALGRGDGIGILCDSATRYAEHHPPFLGTAAATISTPALLSLATGAPVVVATAQRKARFRFKLRVWDIIRHEPTQDRQTDTLAILTRINAGLTRAVTEDPEQWLWQSRRFKRRPPGETPGKDGLPPLAADSSPTLHQEAPGDSWS
ncbi:MAG: lysophospholipid acyltransferase family protein [Planctomycetota bacterium]|nr:lysophospholipid acyltransferase family protein [Planctomycetota bacterium]